jgi:hypothetical protein
VLANRDIRTGQALKLENDFGRKIFCFLYGSLQIVKFVIIDAVPIAWRFLVFRVLLGDLMSSNRPGMAGTVEDVFDSIGQEKLLTLCPLSKALNRV